MADVLTIMSSISKWFQSKNNKMQIYGSLNFEIHVLAEALDQLSHTKSKGKYFTLFQSMAKQSLLIGERKRLRFYIGDELNSTKQNALDYDKYYIIEYVHVRVRLKVKTY
eukprot:410899_1